MANEQGDACVCVTMVTEGHGHSSLPSHRAPAPPCQCGHSHDGLLAGVGHDGQRAGPALATHGLWPTARQLGECHGGRLGVIIHAIGGHLERYSRC